MIEMAKECKGICIRIKYNKKKGDQWYADGIRRCNICAIFIVCTDILCPCCKSQLRGRPKISTHNHRYIDA